MMGSSYYHKFSPVLVDNLWFWLAIAGVITMAILGLRTYYLSRKKRMRKRYRARFLRLMAGAFSVAFMLLLLVESHRGIVQLLDNCLSSSDSPIWSVVMAPFVILFAGMLLNAVLMIVTAFAVTISRMWVEQKAEEYAEERRRQARIDKARREAEEQRKRGLEEAGFVDYTDYLVGGKG